MSTPVKCWDVTVSADTTSKDQVHKFMRKETSNYCFQLEQGNSGYRHYQGRFIFKRKVRLTTLIKAAKQYGEGWHFSPSSALVAAEAKSGKFCYVMKEDTRLEGPWTDQDDPKELTWDIKVLECKDNWYPWQRQAYDFATTRDPRVIHVIYDPKGNSGKSSFLKYLALTKKCGYIPPFTEYEDVMQVAMAKASYGSFWIDMPRAMEKNRLKKLWSAVETIKSGFLFDKRYHWKEVIIGSPQVIVSTNVLPNVNMLSLDRWRFHKITEDLRFATLSIEQIMLGDTNVGFKRPRHSNSAQP